MEDSRGEHWRDVAEDCADNSNINVLGCDLDTREKE